MKTTPAKTVTRSAFATRRAAGVPQLRLTSHELKTEYARHTLERQVQADICAYLRAVRLPFSITNAEATYNVNGQLVKRVAMGWQDLTVCENGGMNPVFAGKLLAIEVKRPFGGKLSYDQAVNLQNIYRANGLICIARSVDDVVAVRATGIRQCDLAEIAAAIQAGPPKPKPKPQRKNV